MNICNKRQCIFCIFEQKSHFAKNDQTNVYISLNLFISCFQVEQLQRKAARCVFNDSSGQDCKVTNMIGTLQWDSLACRRTKASLLLLYKINGGLVEVPTTMLSQSDMRTRGAHTFSPIKIFISFLCSLIQYQSGIV